MSTLLNFTTISLLVLLTACQSLTSSHDYHNDYVIGSYTSSPWGFSTNSFWIEGPSGVILIDTQFLPSAALEAVETAESYTGKKVVLAIVLHANPDKFNGTSLLKERGIRVITSEQVRSLLPAVDKKRRAWFYDRYKPDYPPSLVLPESFGDKTTTISAAGLNLTLYVLGEAVSKAHVVVELDHHLFVGDLVGNQYHGWMELGLSKEWIALLKYLQTLSPNVIHPGRGLARGPELLQTQIDYLTSVEMAVKKYLHKEEPSDEDIRLITEEITEQYPHYSLDYFLNLGIPAEYRRAYHDQLAQ